MNLKIYTGSNKDYYYIAGDESSQKPDTGIAPLLGLTLKEYHEILLKNGAFKCGSGQNCDFKNKEDAEKALEKLEPYLIMAKLVE